MPKLSDELLNVTAGAMPVPLRPAVSGESLALVVVCTEAVFAPVDVGVNVTLMVQLFPAPRLDPQVLLWANMALFVPIRVMPLIVKVAVPVLVSVIA